MRFELSSKDVEMYSEGKRILGSTDSKQLNQQMRTRPNLSLELISLLKRADMLNVQHMFGTWVWNGLNIGYPKIQNVETYSFLEMAIYVGGELSLWPVNIHQITIHIPMKYPIPMAYVSPLWLALVVPHGNCHGTITALVCPVAASCPEAPVASPLLRAGVRKDGDRSEADLGTRDRKARPILEWSISLGGKPHVEQSIVTIIIILINTTYHYISMFVTYLNMVNMLFLLKSHFGSGFKPNLRSQLTSRKHWRPPEKEKKTLTNMTNKGMASTIIPHLLPRSTKSPIWPVEIPYLLEWFSPASILPRLMTEGPHSLKLSPKGRFGPDMVAPNHIKSGSARNLVDRKALLGLHQQNDFTKKLQYWTFPKVFFAGWMGIFASSCYRWMAARHCSIFPLEALNIAANQQHCDLSDGM